MLFNRFLFEYHGWKFSIFTILQNLSFFFKMQGCIFFIPPPPRGKNMSYWLVGEKIWWFIKKKNAKLKGKWLKNGGKVVHFHFQSFWEKGCGAKISYFGNIHYTPLSKFSDNIDSHPNPCRPIPIDKKHSHYIFSSFQNILYINCNTWAIHWLPPLASLLQTSQFHG